MTVPSVEAYINLEGNGYSINPRGGMFPCDLYGDVFPGAYPGDFEITAIRVGSEHVSFTDELEGARFREAEQILLNDADWSAWAEEVCGADADCRRPAGGDPGSTHIDAGVRI